MRLLIVTQIVDKDDSILGFFHRWIIEFAKNCESIIVICLKEGKHDLPANVKVLSLGKEDGASRIKYVARFYSYIWSERKNYDAVFVHMNPIYVVLGGLIWRLIGKNISLWYTHKSVDVKLRLAEKITDIIFTASKESFRLASRKLIIVGHGIDTELFCPNPGVQRESHLLSVGRLSSTKRHDLAISAAKHAGRNLRIVGDGSLRDQLISQAENLGVPVQFTGSLTQTQLLSEYRRASFLIHTSETGSLDKVVLEALSCGLPVVTTSASLSDMPITKSSDKPNDIAACIRMMANTDQNLLSSYVSEHHSLGNLIPVIVGHLENI